MFDKLSEWARRRLTPHSPDDAPVDLPAPPSLSDFLELPDTRMVVLDLETSGLNVSKDLVLAIGAVAIEQGRIDFADQFERVFHQPTLKQDDTVLIHGLGPETLARGVPPREGLLDFLRWAGPAAFIAFHAPFDKRMLGRALKAHCGMNPKYVWLDLADLLPALFQDAEVGPGRLDNWVEYFNLDVSERHNASADALATAELMLIALRQARAQAIETLPQLAEKARLHRRLRENRQGF